MITTFSIPEYYTSKINREFGSLGKAWLQQVPGLIVEYCQRWQLSGLQLLANLSINLLFFAVSAVHGEVVLKLNAPHPERATEIIALQNFDTRLACPCYAAEPERGVLLLKRIRPGHTLLQLADRQARLDLGTVLISRLPVQLTTASTPQLPTYNHWLETARQKAGTRYAPPPGLSGLLKQATALYRELEKQYPTNYLLHGDLHHENILLSGRDTWLAVDPQGVTGVRCLECARFIQNHVVQNPARTINEQVLEQAVRQFASALQVSPVAIAGSLFILHVLSACWGCEMNYAKALIKKLVSECRFYRIFYKLQTAD